jgi:hypothetical protein
MEFETQCNCNAVEIDMGLHLATEWDGYSAIQYFLVFNEEKVQISETMHDEIHRKLGFMGRV